MRSVGSLHRHEAPTIALLQPGLVIRDADRRSIGRLHLGAKDITEMAVPHLVADNFRLQALCLQGPSQKPIRICFGTGSLPSSRSLRPEDSCCRAPSTQSHLRPAPRPSIVQTGQRRHPDSRPVRRREIASTPRTTHRATRFMISRFTAIPPAGSQAISSYCSRRCRPVNRTNTSSRLACRVVRCCN